MELGLIANPADIDTLACLYYAFKECGRIDDIFDGHDLIWWLNQFNERQSWLCVIGGQIVGFGLVNALDKNCLRAEVSFGMLPTCGGRDAVRFGRMMLKALFEANLNLMYVYGTTPSRNRVAVKFARLIGMRIVGQTPNYLSFHGEIDDAVISYVERKEVLNED